MKSKSIFIYAILLVMSFTSCDKNFEEINTDPTKLTESNFRYNYLFTSAQLYAAGNFDGYSNGTWQSSVSYASSMMQHLSSTNSWWYGDKYIYNETYNSSFWQYQYSTAIKSIVDVINNVKVDESKKNFYNISRILKVWMFHRVTDIYGDVPYSEAGMGYATGLVTPKYDKQQDIYADMLKELDEAAQQLNSSADNALGDADLFYEGDITQWKKFAYSLMLRLGMRLSKVDAANAEAWVKKAVAGGVMESNDDNAIVHQEAKGTHRESNGVGLQLRSREPSSYKMSKTFIDFLKNNNDPRLVWLATVIEDTDNTEDLGDNTASIQIGQPNGYDKSGTATDISNAPNWPGAQNKYSTVNRMTYSREDAPTFFLTYAETALLEAEAAQKGWIEGDAATYYADGVRAAILQLNQTGAEITESAADTYITAHPYVAANGLQMINEQYWVATFADWLETWANWRRSGYPVLTPIVYQGNNTNGTIPRRFTYPMDEANVNPVNYSSASSSISGGDKMTSRVWWDKE